MNGTLLGVELTGDVICDQDGLLKVGGLLGQLRLGIQL